MLLCLMSGLVSSLVPCLVSYLIYRSINIQVLLYFIETERPVCQRTNTNSADRPTLPINISTILSALYRCTLKTIVCTVTAASIAGRVTVALILDFGCDLYAAIEERYYDRGM